LSPIAAASVAAQEAAEGGAGFAIGVAVALVVVALGLFFLEVLFPSFGLITILAIGCMVGSILLAFSVGSVVGTVFVAVAVFTIPAAIYSAFRLLPRTSLVLQAEAAEAPEQEAPKASVSPGDKGVALTPLRPSGTAAVNGRRVSVVTSGEVVEPNEQVEVTRVEGTRIVVRPVRA
jgi:membrane-bound serine protease (ClpP class)